MANKKTLRDFSERQKDEVRAIQSMGGKARVAKQRKLKEMREYVRDLGLMEVNAPDLNGEDAPLPALAAVVVSMFRRAIFKGDVKAAKFIAELVGAYKEQPAISAGFIIQVGNPQLADAIDKALKN